VGRRGGLKGCGRFQFHLNRSRDDRIPSGTGLTTSKQSLTENHKHEGQIILVRKETHYKTSKQILQAEPTIYSN
jgi:hypothetical protein